MKKLILISFLAMPFMAIGGVNYAGQNLNGQDFSGQNLFGANFKGASLQNANFNNANLIEADFQGADLRGASFDNTIFCSNGSWWDGFPADLRDAIFDLKTARCLQYISRYTGQNCSYRFREEFIDDSGNLVRINTTVENGYYN